MGNELKSKKVVNIFFFGSKTRRKQDCSLNSTHQISRPFNKHELTLIAQQIDDSLTWCRFAQVSRMCKEITDKLLVKKSGNYECNDTVEWFELPNGEYHGTCQQFSETTGQLVRERKFKDGKDHGFYRKWHSNGQLVLEYNYKDGKEHGFHRKWHSNGQLCYECNYKDGKKHGFHRKWSENGQLLYESNYKDGHIYGINREWYDNGQLRIKRLYKNGNTTMAHRLWWWTRDGQLLADKTYGTKTEHE